MQWEKLNFHPPCSCSKHILLSSYKSLYMQFKSLGFNHFILRNSVIVSTECFSTKVDTGNKMTEYIESPWWSMVACRLNLWGPAIIIMSIGMTHLFCWYYLFSIQLNWSTMVRDIAGCKIGLVCISKVFIHIETGVLSFLLHHSYNQFQQGCNINRCNT